MDKEHIKEEQKYQDSIAKYYFESYESDYVKKRWDYPLLEKYLKYVQKGIVLDLGCGTGATSYFYSKNNYQVISSDLSTEMLKKVKERGNDSILLNSLAESIPLKDNSVSHVVCFGAFHHFNNKKKSLEEINRVLKKNGTLG